MRRGLHRSGGFTLLEALITMGILVVIAAMGFPALQRQIHRSQMESVARNCSVLMQRSRFEAIRESVQTVVRIDQDAREVVAFADVHGATQIDPGDGLLNPIDGLPNRVTDYEIGRIQLPENIQFEAPVPGEEVVGFTEVNDEQVALFQPNGSVTDEGAFRIADTRGNFLEVRASPPATARIQLRKWNETLPPGEDGTHWYRAREGGEPWKWY